MGSDRRECLEHEEGLLGGETMGEAGLGQEDQELSFGRVNV